MNRAHRLAAALCVAAPAGAAAQGAIGGYDLAGEPAWRAELPADMAEVSGLAFSSKGQLYMHGDEQASIRRFDPAARRPAERFGFAGKAGLLQGDFEDIQVVGDRIFLVTSTGAIWEGGIGASDRMVPATRHTRGLEGCEIEGMEWDAPSRSLLLLCKEIKSRRWKDQVVILAVSTETWRFEAEPRILVPEEKLEAVTGAKRFNGSAIARHPRTGTFLLVAGPQSAYAEIDTTGRVLGGGALDKKRHPQPEGAAFAPDLTLLISDEAAGRAATLTAYAYRR